MLKATIFFLLIAHATLGQAPPASNQEGPPPQAAPPEGQQGGFQGPPPPWAIPHYRLLHADEDWSYLADPRLRGHDWFDPIKYIPLGKRDNWYLTLGGEVREWFESYKNENWGAPPF